MIKVKNLIKFFQHKSKYTYIARTHSGRVKSNNEDNLYVNGIIKENESDAEFIISGQCDDKLQLFAVCDGMGGEEYGEVASLLAVRELAPYKIVDLETNLDRCVSKINQSINSKRADLEVRTMGTTFAGIYIDGNKAVASNVGDSRVYLYRKGKLQQLTEDHSELQSLLNMGFSPENLSRRKGGNALTQYLGVDESEIKIEPYYSEIIDIEDDDIFLVCSDGVTDMINDESILSIINSSISIEEAAEKIEQQAIEAGGRDNITVVFVCAESRKTVAPSLILVIGIVIAVLATIVFVGMYKSQNSGGSVSDMLISENTIESKTESEDNQVSRSLVISENKINDK